MASTQFRFPLCFYSILAAALVLVGLAAPARAEVGRLAGIDDLITQAEARSGPPRLWHQAMVEVAVALRYASEAERDSVDVETIDRIARLLRDDDRRYFALGALRWLGLRAMPAVPSIEAAMLRDCAHINAIPAEARPGIRTGPPSFVEAANDDLRHITGRVFVRPDADHFEICETRWPNVSTEKRAHALVAQQERSAAHTRRKPQKREIGE